MYPKRYKKCKKVFKNVLKIVQNCRKTCKNVKKCIKCTVNICKVDGINGKRFQGLGKGSKKIIIITVDS